jgi:hypothetical protein
VTAKTFNFSANLIREALSRIEDTSQESLTPPPRGNLYMPLGHVKALSLTSSVVVGMRGSGKSYWTAVLASKLHREQLAKAARLPDLITTHVCVGFALDPSSDDFPSVTVLRALRDKKADASDVWYAVILQHALGVVRKQYPILGDWKKKIDWVSRNKEKALEILSECDREISTTGKNLLVVFDALDRLSNDWEEIRDYIRALLIVALECRSRRSIKLKIFLRPDVEEDEAIWKFVDSSKIRANIVELRWRPYDLFGLVILNLANSAVVGEEFREEISKVVKLDWQEDDGAYFLPRTLSNGEQPARAIIEAISGAWVGTSAKRGYVYTWIPTHLADAKNRLSPRSFLLAFRSAAEWTESHEPDHERALHFKGIQQGVATASEIRVSEISEDYPWVKPLLEAARGLTVPCYVDDLTVSWPKGLAEVVRKTTGSKLPPRRFNTDSIRKGRIDALVEDLVELAVLYRTSDGRLNIPDIFRVGFGIKRMGGVRPPR